MDYYDTYLKKPINKNTDIYEGGAEIKDTIHELEEDGWNMLKYMLVLLKQRKNIV